MQSPQATVFAIKQVFDALRGIKVKRVAYGSGPAFMAKRAPAALRIVDVLAGALANDGGVFTSRCVLRFRWRFH